MGFINIRDLFLCCEEQEEFFKKMQQTHPSLFECVASAAKEKAKKNREVLVTLYKKEDGACPRECRHKDLESFFSSERFEVHTNTVATFYNTKDSIIYNVFVVGL